MKKIQQQPEGVRAEFFSSESKETQGKTGTRCFLYVKDNHLGNVLVTLSDRKTQVQNGSSTDYFMSDVRSYGDYSLFGVKLAGRNGGVYKYGFNGQEKDDEMNGDYAFEYRIHDPRLGRFLSVDPLAAEYPWNSTYAFAENDVIRSIDLEGAEKLITTGGYELSEGEARAAFGSTYDPNNTDVYTANLNGQYDADGNWVQNEGPTYKVGQQLFKPDGSAITYDEFMQIAALGYNENTTDAHAQQATQNVLINRAIAWYDGDIAQAMNEFAGSGVGSSHQARMASKYFPNYQSFYNASAATRNASAGMKSANAGAIQALMGNDITNGATFEHGVDMWIPGWSAYDGYYLAGFNWASDGTFMGTHTPATDPARPNATTGKYKYTITATYGGNTYLKVYAPPPPPVAPPQPVYTPADLLNQPGDM